MSHDRVRLATALRATAERLRAGAPYQWGHFGACNCGHLAQTLTDRSPAEIHRAALARATGFDGPEVDDWADAAVEHCPASGLPLDAILDEMLGAGLTLADVRHLERLSDPRIVRRVGRYLARNRRDDLVAYLTAWADLIEEDLTSHDTLDWPLAAE